MTKHRDKYTLLEVGESKRMKNPKTFALETGQRQEWHGFITCEPETAKWLHEQLNRRRVLTEEEKEIRRENGRKSKGAPVGNLNAIKKICRLCGGTDCLHGITLRKLGRDS